MKKRNIMKTLFAGTMTLGMALSVSPAFAKEVQEGTENNPAELWLAKELNIADGVTLGDTDFKFIFTQTGYNNGAPSTNYQVPINPTLTVSSNDKTDSKNVLENVKFPAAGVYTYTVSEDQTGDKGAEEYGMDYSNAKYTVNVYVKNKENSQETYVYSVTVNQNKNDQGEDVTSPDTGKVDPNPTPGDDTGDDSEFRFVNTYTKKAEGTIDPDNPDNKLALLISKKVTGQYGDKTRGFTFNVKIKLPDTADKTNIYTGTVEDIEYQFSHNNDTEVTLSDGQSLKFEDLPVGTTYDVAEVATIDYQPSAIVTENGIEGTETIGTMSKALTITNKKVGESSNKAAFTNDYNDEDVATPTGIFINNLPFVLMVVVAGSGLALYVVSKRRSHQ